MGRIRRAHPEIPDKEWEQTMRELERDGHMVFDVFTHEWNSTPSGELFFLQHEINKTLAEIYRAVGWK